MAADLRKIYQAFDPAPLSGEDNELYVPLDEVRGSSGLVTKLSKMIRLSDKANVQLLAGHIGSGKSTELRRVQHELEKGDKRFFTVFCTILDDIDPSDADFPDVLLAIVRQVACELRERLKIKLKPGYFKHRWEELRDLLGAEVTFDGVELEAGLGKITGAIKGSPSTRIQIRQALEPTTDSWIGAANDVLGEAVQKLVKKGYEGLVIIVDDLDKLSVEERLEDRRSVAERLFVTRHAQLTAFQSHMIYTIPIALAYSCKEREIASLYGVTAPPVVPMTKIFGRDGTRHAPGFNKFKDLIARRLKKAGATEKEVFASAAVKNQIVRCTGGQPRFLVTLIRDCLVEGELPLTKSTVDTVARKATHSYARQLREEHWEIIEQVRQSQELKRTADNDALCMELLSNRAVLQYLNETEWYGLNPLLPKRASQ
jgi:type II secretory pathway predicted ATPase ExeA